ncbi:MAG: hypothetical protein COW25_00045 [Candidatus Nealsonbacteria bacterium CG15_BIG_FIL_POST_REV_8_21_14_020_37_12]|uniref:Transmembrane protein (PGPGW) n=1 Tax=Candidatus Nealsonbacteria bacterium CG15_BIG_FIL_POST_REV_8_21_14_020_37_12 TaxID=1974716 RepID=A0A2M7H206_9BACT|nr:MAG: hypothetical protein COW25_00045 [Candidatus Nealsonbacteria bacterium CG15_BIG_FIL_POST_REV_8_21_14_020_37_12]
MFTNLFKTIKEYIHNRPKLKKVVGVILILIGLAAFFTPLTPGSWLAIIGLELLGVRQRNRSFSRHRRIPTEPRKIFSRANRILSLAKNTKIN